MKNKLLNYFLFLFVLQLNSCASQKSTIYSQMPKPIKKAIENNFEYSNVFFYRVFESDNTFLCWYYNQSIVSWFSYVNGKLSKSGSFESENNANGLTISQTNGILKKELDAFHKTCTYALDGEYFGYILRASSSLENTLPSENIVRTWISTECLSNIENVNFIAKDFKKIRDLNYKVEVIP